MRAPLLAAYNVLVALSAGLVCERHSETWSFVAPSSTPSDLAVRDDTVSELIAAGLARESEADEVCPLVSTEKAAPYLTSVARRAATQYRGYFKEEERA